MTRTTAALGLALLVVCALNFNSAAGAKSICKAHPETLTGNAAVARNLKTVQGIYAAFATGDVPAILDCVSEDVAWESWTSNYAQRAKVPWLKAQFGRAGAAAFFAYTGKWKVNAFAVKNVMAAGANVAAELEVDFDVTQTGGRVRDQEIHYWTFNARGQVVGLRHYADTAKHIAVAKGARE